VSPYDPGGIADGIEAALTMSPSRRRSRMRRIRETVDGNDLQTWIDKHETAARAILAEQGVQQTST